MKRATVVINPIAGPGRASTISQCEALAKSILETDGGYAVTTRVTSGPDDARRFAEEAVGGGANLVVAWGGDGTVNGVAAAVARTSATLGIVAGGSGNGLARDLGLPLEAAAALKVIAKGTTRSIDAGEINGELFFNVAGIGLDAVIAAAMADHSARRGLLGYVLSTVRVLRRYRPHSYSLRFSGSGGAIDTRALFIALANSKQYGIGARIAPKAILDDGILDVVIVQPQSGWLILTRVPALFRGTLTERAGIIMRTGSSFEIHSPDGIAFHVDGEPRQSSSTLKIQTLPKALLVTVNPSSSTGSGN